MRKAHEKETNHDETPNINFAPESTILLSLLPWEDQRRKESLQLSIRFVSESVAAVEGLEYIP